MAVFTKYKRVFFILSVENVRLAGSCWQRLDRVKKDER